MLWLSWLVLALGILGAYFAFRLTLSPIRNRPVDPALELKGHFVRYVVMFLLLAALIGSAASLFWLNGGIVGVVGPSDTAQLAFESANILGVGQALSIAVLGLVVPMLISLWTDHLRRLDELVDRVRRTALQEKTDRESALAVLDRAMNQRDQIDSAAALAEPLFKRSIAICIVLIILFGTGFFRGHIPTQAYLIAVLACGWAMIEVAWFFSLLGFFVFEIQPGLRVLARDCRNL